MKINARSFAKHLFPSGKLRNAAVEFVSKSPQLLLLGLLSRLVENLLKLLELANLLVLAAKDGVELVNDPTQNTLSFLIEAVDSFRQLDESLLIRTLIQRQLLLLAVRLLASRLLRRGRWLLRLAWLLLLGLLPRRQRRLLWLLALPLLFATTLRRGKQLLSVERQGIPQILRSAVLPSLFRR